MSLLRIIGPKGRLVQYFLSQKEKKYVLKLKIFFKKNFEAIPYKKKLSPARNFL